MSLCANRKCREETEGWLCPSCRYIGKWGMFIGGMIIGVIGALLKLVK
jgi:hypothetical protein